MRNVERIANDPRSYPDGKLPSGAGRHIAHGEMVGPKGETVRVKVVVEPQGEGVVTAHPVDVPRNPRR
jgi:hypothetical protein